MTVRIPIAIAVVAAFAGGLASSRLPGLFERDAQAQTWPQPASVYVPAEGLVFRALDGRAIARLAYDARGGSFEVYDSRERPAGSLRAGLAAAGSLKPAQLGAPLAAPMATAMTMPPGEPDLGY